MLLGAALVFFLFPGREGELRLLAEYRAQDTAPPAAAPAPAPAPPLPLPLPLPPPHDPT